MLQGLAQQGEALQLGLWHGPLVSSRQQHQCIAWQHGMQPVEASDKYQGEMCNRTRAGSMAKRITR